MMVLGRSGSAFVGHVGQALSGGQAPGSSVNSHMLTLSFGTWCLALPLNT